jgi:Sulfotransferase family
MADKIYLFVCVPNNSGSSMLAEMLSRASGAAGLELDGRVREGQAVTMGVPHPRDFKAAKNWAMPEAIAVFRDETKYNWPQVQSDWHLLWDRKPNARVLVEKSPPNVVRWSLLQKHFPDSKFVLGLRDPYAFCASMLTKDGRPVADAAGHWLRAAKLQAENVQAIGENGFWLTYESVCRDVAKECSKLQEWLPDIGIITPPRIKYSNEERMKSLTPEQMTAINAVLAPEEKAIRGIGYELQRK